MWNRQQLTRVAGLALVAAAPAVWFALVRPARVRAADEDEAPAPKIALGDLEAHVKVVAARAGELPVRLRALGVIVAAPDAPCCVVARVAGPVTAVEARDGQAVAAGAVLVRLDERPARDAAARATAALQAAEAERARASGGGLDVMQAELDVAAAQAQVTAEQAAKEADRQEGLLAEHLAAEKAATEARSAADAAARARKLAADKAGAFPQAGRAAELARLEAAVELARADLHAAERDAQAAVLCAPCAGRVVGLAATVGRTLEAGATVAQVVTDATLCARVHVAPADAGAVAAGARAAVHADGGHSGPGTVRSIGGGVDPETGLVPVLIALESAPDLPRPGTTVFVDLETGAAASGILLPGAALLVAEDAASVVTVDDKQLAHITSVKLLARDAENVVVAAEGLAAGARVVVEGNYNLPDGAHVVVEPAK